MSEKDRVRWDAAYTSRGGPAGEPAPPPAFAAHTDAFPARGTALDLACGQGLGSVWLARRGLDVWGVDVSAIAVEQATELAARCGVASHCRFDVVDLDDGLPPGPRVDVVICHRFRDSRLDDPIVKRLAPGGLLAVCALSEVGAAPGRFRAAPGELVSAFAGLDVIAAGEGDGEAWLLARLPGPAGPGR
ncbi:class I SAM-dependent methyltransferase [Mycolicibacterium septicum]|uniref:class I SAM-dependent methyltransferase n=1 Tax=Mycolicibacterium septicum TaxID=98668 RepID=UPI0023E0D7A1|nr:class I SAM-dependent methyltransferase [Mycolicibacterium septicum]MDF3338107.1 class I SAM-dependent methyltransferase [Mycolicibacterium septicum]